MKVRLQSIPFVGGLDTDFSIPATDFKSVRERADESFDEPVLCHAHLEHSGDDVFLTAQASTTIHTLCYRCGEPSTYPLDLKLFSTCTPRQKKSVMARTRASKGKFWSSSDLHQESEEGLVFFDRDELDLTEIIREQVLLSLPMRYLCQENCPGPAR